MHALLKSFFRTAFCALFVCLCATVSPAQNEQSIIVLVNDEPITNYDVTQRMRLMTVTRRVKATKELRKKVIEDLIAERIQIQEATKGGVVLSDEQVEEVFERVAKNNNLTPDKMEAALAQMGVNAVTMKDQIRARLSWRSVVQRKFRSQVNVNASQIDRAMSETEAGEEEQKQSKATEFQLQRVRLELPSSPDQKDIAERLVEAGRLRARLRSCSNIAEVVKPFRKASVKSVGRKKAEQMAQPTRAILRATREGESTPPTITSSGIELYMVCARRTIVAADDKQRQEVRTKLVTEEYEILARRHLRDLRQDAFVEYR